VIDQGRLRDLLSSAAYSNVEKLLICLAVDPLGPRQVKDLRAAAVASGLRKSNDWNISQMFANVPELAVRTSGGWELTGAGMQKIAELVGPSAATTPPKIAAGLRSHLSKLKSLDSKNFLEEAVLCFEGRHYRAAVVLSWVGAISVLHVHVLANKISEFNTEAVRRDPKWKPAKTTDDLSRMKESDFLQCLEAISVIGKNVRQELEICLKLRNACGHPNSLQLGEARVASHVETLLLNVFANF
jgi:hypothetical protein